MEEPQSETLHVKGKVIVRAHPAGTLHLYDTLMDLGHHDQARALLDDGEIKVVQDNLVVDSLNYGLDLLVQYLISAYNGSFAFPLGIAWGEIGTGSTSPANSDTALTTPFARTSIAYAADSGYTTAQTQFFFPDSVLANTTYHEFGTFIGGTSTIGTGNMFNHALFSSPYSKSAGVDTTCEVDFTFSNS